MSHLRAHRLLSVAMQRIERGEKPRHIMHAIKGAVEDLQDPFAGEIDEFLKEKTRKGGGSDINDSNGDGGDGGELANDPNEELREDGESSDSPQEEIEERMEEAAEEEPGLNDDMPGDTPQDAPQQEAEDKYEDEQEEAKDDKADELEERKKDIQDEIDKVQKEDEKYAESALREIAKIAQERGYSALANRFIKASVGGVADLFNDLLMREYLQRDISVNYFYVFDDTHAEYLKDHFKSEKGRMVYLQKAILDLGGTPTLKRLAIPPVNPLTSDGVMALITEMERQAVTEYLAAAKTLEGYPEYATLKVWLETVASEEATDTKEMEKLDHGATDKAE